MESAFGVTLDDYEKEGKKFHSYTGTISMPQEHAEPVEAVLGLGHYNSSIRQPERRGGRPRVVVYLKQMIVYPFV